MNSIKYYYKHPLGIFLSLLNKFGKIIPDKKYLELRFKIMMGYKPNLTNPKTFQEKIQWLKLYNRNPLYTTLVDKYAVKSYVKELIGDKFIIPTLGVWDKFDDINFASLPNQFVLKTTHGGGSCGVVICKDKHRFDQGKARKILEKSLDSDIYSLMREWPYKDVPRRIIAEPFIEMVGKTDLTDYKFFCFGGVPKYVQIIQDRHTAETIDFFDMEWNHQEFVGLGNNCKMAKTIPSIPSNFNIMVDIASKLAKGLPFIRVDLYNIDGKIYFGELTFYPASGFGEFSPNKWSYTLGDLIICQ